MTRYLAKNCYKYLADHLHILDNSIAEQQFTFYHTNDLLTSLRLSKEDPL